MTEGACVNFIIALSFSLVDTLLDSSLPEGAFKAFTLEGNVSP